MHLADINWLPVLRRTVGIAAIVMALAVAAVWAVNLSMTTAAVAEAGANGFYFALLTLAWLEIITAFAVLAGLAVGGWLHRPLWAPGVFAVVVGMAMHWGWWVLDRKVDLFGTSGFNDPDPELVRRAAVRMWVMLGFDSLAVLLLLLGGALLLRRARPAGPAPDVADDEALDGASAG